MTERQGAGLLSSAEIRDLAAHGEIETVWAVTPDLWGRPVGKRFSAKFFVDEVLDRQTDLPAAIFFRDIGGTFLQPPSAIRVDPGGLLACRPDAASMRRAAWLDRTAVAVCDLVDPLAGEPHAFSPRATLKRQLERARSASVTARGACDLEFYLATPGRLDAAVSPAGDARLAAADYQAIRLDGATDISLQMQHLLRASGVPLEHVRAAAGAAQLQAAPQHAALLEAADRAMIAKWAIKEIAASAGHAASFMACREETLPMCAMELHVSLVSSDREVALFAGKDAGECGGELPMACRWWLGGLLRHARDSTLLFAPTVNSYKRFRGDAGASSVIGWARDRRAVGFRVTGDGARRHVTCSLAGADANPYLVTAVVLAAGLDGMANRIDVGPAVARETGSIRGLPRLPLGIVEAAELASQSSFVRQSLGESCVEYLAHCGRWEQARFEASVTSWEYRRYGESV